jgi:hypothetical protein
MRSLFLFVSNPQGISDVRDDATVQFGRDAIRNVLYRNSKTVCDEHVTSFVRYSKFKDLITRFHAPNCMRESARPKNARCGNKRDAIHNLPSGSNHQAPRRRRLSENYPIVGATCFVFSAMGMAPPSHNSNPPQRRWNWRRHQRSKCPSSYRGCKTLVTTISWRS